MRRISNDVDFILQYDEREKAMRDQTAEIETAEERGAMNKARETAINLLTAGVDKNIIMMSLKLSEEQLDKIIKEQSADREVRESGLEAKIAK